MKKSILLSFVASVLLMGFCSCDKNTPHVCSNTITYIQSSGHYLVFSTNDYPEYFKMDVFKNDTWESLEHYFPCVPHIKGTTGAWIKPEGGIYHENEKEVIVQATYYSIY